MELRSLIAALPSKKAAVYTFERGKTVKHPHAALTNDVAQARGALTAWGVRPGMRVGIFAPNSYQWLVYDLALIDLGVISVAFTDDFAGTVNDELLAKLGKHSLGKGCLYIKRLEDVDLSILNKLIVEAVKRAKKQAQDDAKMQAKSKK